jgi:hypothetical protein
VTTSSCAEGALLQQKCPESAQPLHCSCWTQTKAATNVQSPHQRQRCRQLWAARPARPMRQHLRIVGRQRLCNALLHSAQVHALLLLHLQPRPGRATGRRQRPGPSGAAAAPTPAARCRPRQPRAPAAPTARRPAAPAPLLKHGRPAGLPVGPQPHAAALRLQLHLPREARLASALAAL